MKALYLIPDEQGIYHVRGYVRTAQLASLLGNVSTEHIRSVVTAPLPRVAARIYIRSLRIPT
jgi:hypothetical protein